MSPCTTIPLPRAFHCARACATSRRAHCGPHGQATTGVSWEGLSRKRRWSPSLPGRQVTGDTTARGGAAEGGLQLTH
jgi:hypothetical protein